MNTTKQSQAKSVPNHKLADAVMKAIGQTLANLKSRWRDEGKFEDFAEYEAVIARKINTVEGVNLLSMNKKFEVKWVAYSDMGVRVTSIKGRSVQTIRIA